MCFSVEWTGWHCLSGSQGWDRAASAKKPLEALGFPVGRQAHQTCLGMSPRSQLLALDAMAGRGPWPAGEAVPVS